MTSAYVARRRVRPIRFAAQNPRCGVRSGVPGPRELGCTGRLARGQVTGQWVQSFNVGRGMSARAAAYQKQISGCSPTKEFNLTCGQDSANFDGYRRGVLLEAKYYFDSIRSLPLARVRRLLDQARRQCRLANAAGLPLEWHVASLQGARALCQLFDNNGVRSIPVYYTPPERLR
jgi:hypothetical protein